MATSAWWLSLFAIFAMILVATNSQALGSSRRDLPAMRMANQTSGRPLTYSNDLGKRYLLMSYAAYCPVAALQPWGCKWCNAPGIKVVGFFSYAPTELFGFVAVDQGNNEIIISFRGTHNVENWVVDLKAIKLIAWPLDPSSGIYVADGFYVAWSNVQSQVVKLVELAQQQVPGATLTFTGHSLGAAMAHDAASFWVKTGRASAGDISVITLGQPRSGDLAYAKWFDQQPWATSYRLTNYKDVVPHLPPKSFGFQHNAQEVFFDKGSSDWTAYVVCDGSGEDSKCSDQFFLPTSIYDHLHYMGLYEDCDPTRA